MANNSPHHIVRGAFITPELQIQFNEAAWTLRGSKSALLVAELRAFAADPNIFTGELAPPSGPAKFHAQMQPRLWADVQAGAEFLGIPVSHVVRIALARIVARATPRPRKKSSSRIDGTEKS